MLVMCRAVMYLNGSEGYQVAGILVVLRVAPILWAAPILLVRQPYHSLFHPPSCQIHCCTDGGGDATMHSQLLCFQRPRYVSFFVGNTAGGQCWL